MWIVKKKTGDKYGVESIEVATEREAFEYCREMGHDYYYEFLSQAEYMKRKIAQWKKEKKEQC